MNIYFYIIISRKWKNKHKHNNHHFYKLFQKGQRNWRKIQLLNYLLRFFDSSNQVITIIMRMKQNDLLNFLNFFRDSCFSIERPIIPEHRNCLQIILMACDRYTITGFLNLIEFDLRFEIIQQNTQIWIQYLIGLFEQRTEILISLQIGRLGIVFGNDFGQSLIELIGRQVENEDLEHYIRFYIFSWIVQREIVLSYVVQTIYEPYHPENTRLKNVREWVQQTIERNQFDLQVQIDNVEQRDDEPHPPHV